MTISTPDPQARHDISVAVLLPCHNNAATVAASVRGFAEALPGAAIHVFDNRSSDDTALEAARAGARVFRENHGGKGGVVRRMFADVEADIYLMAAADGSCDPADASSLVNALITEHVDMVVGARSGPARGAPAWLRRSLLGGDCADMTSVYRAFTRRFVKSFPAIPAGFPIETEMSIHASQLMIPTAEIELSAASLAPPDRRSPDTLIRRMAMAAGLLRETRPFLFYAIAAVAFWIAGLIVALPPLFGRIDTGVVDSTAATLIGMGLFAIGFIVAGGGLVLESVGRSRIEQKRVLFLAVPRLAIR